MYKYRVDDETTKKALAVASGGSTSKVEDLIKDLASYDKLYDYNSTIPMDRVEYDRMENVVIDQDAIAEDAKLELKDYKDNTIAKINSDIEAKILDQESKKQKAEDTYNMSKANAKEYYEKVREDASQDALRRGLSRSSIIINKLDAFDKAELDRYNALNDELNASINEIDNSISSLKSQQTDALRNFDIEYAVKLQDKINSKIEELEKKQEEVIKYNNEIAEKENEYNTKYAQLLEDLQQSNWDKEKELMEYAGKYGVNMLSNYKATQKYNIAEKYLDNISSADAVHLLKNNAELRELLGNSNIDKLLKKYS
ncbi:MAG: hypothetical protein E7361_00275 [Clostridiales bacterium]|nr:hypothetical protein [Clostridiales bacterium]